MPSPKPTFAQRYPLRSTWYGMRLRCSRNAKKTDRAAYFKRGIKVLWPSFAAFSGDMLGSYNEHCIRYGAKNTLIDRIDNDGHYSKENCRWATHKEQMRNKRSNRLILFKGVLTPLTDVSRSLFGNKTTLSNRLRRGWPLEEAISRPPFAHGGARDGLSGKSFLGRHHSLSAKKAIGLAAVRAAALRSEQRKKLI